MIEKDYGYTFEMRANDAAFVSNVMRLLRARRHAESASREADDVLHVSLDSP